MADAAGNNGSDSQVTRNVGDPIPELARLTFIVVGVVYVIVGVLGNAVVIVTVATNRRMHNPHYAFIVNLALSDLVITGYVVSWTVAGLLLGYYPVFTQGNCAFNGFVVVVSYVASLLTIMLISVNRYLNICHRHLFAKIFSRKYLHSVIYCFLIWLVAGLYVMPPLLGWGRFHFDTKTHYCGYDRTFNFSYTLFLVIGSIGVSIVIILASNVAIWRFIRKSSQKIEGFRRGTRLHSLSLRTPRAKSTTSISTFQSHRTAQEHGHEQIGDQTQRTAAKSVCSVDKLDRLALAVSNNVWATRLTHSPFQDASEREARAATGLSMRSPNSYVTHSPHLNIPSPVPRTHRVQPVGMLEPPSTATYPRTSPAPSVAPPSSKAPRRPSVLSPGRATPAPRAVTPTRAPRAPVKDPSPVSPTCLAPSVNLGLSLQASRSEAGALLIEDHTGLLADRGSHTGKHLRNTVKETKPSIRGIFVTADEMALVKSLFVIFVCFAVLMTPYMVATVLDTSNTWPSVVHLACSYTSFTNSCLNWILYGMMNKNFLRTYKRLFCLGQASEKTRDPGRSKSLVMATSSIAFSVRESGDDR